MKKLIALLAVCGFALAFVACGKKTETTAQETDSSAVEQPVVVDSAAADTTATDTTAAH